MSVAVIPARGGSRRIPRKNIRLFGGRPIIAWSIAAARESGLFDRVVVSTNDSEIADIAQAYGAEVPFVRPASLADDHAGTVAVVSHAIEMLQADAVSHERGTTAKHVCCLYATAPFVTPDDLHRSFELLVASNADFCISVTNYSFPIQRAVRILADGRMSMFHPEHERSRSQDLEEAYHDAGQFYWGRVPAWIEARPLFGAGSVAFRLPRCRVQDIDTEEDWQMAERLLRMQEREDALADHTHAQRGTGR